MKVNTATNNPIRSRLFERKKKDINSYKPKKPRTIDQVKILRSEDAWSSRIESFFQRLFEKFIDKYLSLMGVV